MPSDPPTPVDPEPPALEVPAGLVLESPPTEGSKHPKVREYGPWLREHPKTEVRIIGPVEPELSDGGTFEPKDASALAAAFNRLDGFHATYKTTDGKSKVWVTFDPDKPRATRGSSAS